LSEENAVIVADDDPTLTGAEPDGGEGEGGAEPDGGNEKASVRQLREENARLKRTTEELQQESRWHARQVQELQTKLIPPQPAAAAAEDLEPGVDEFVTELSTGGLPVLRKYLKPGISEELVRKVIREELGGVSKQAQEANEFYADFPEARDTSSRLFKLTQAEMETITKRDPDQAGRMSAMRMAAEIAKLKLDAESRNNDRARRVNASGGYGMESYDDGDVNDGAIRLMPRDKFVANQMGITEEKDLKSVLGQKKAINVNRKAAAR
jgi:hypothetical protein